MTVIVIALITIIDINTEECSVLLSKFDDYLILNEQK